MTKTTTIDLASISAKDACNKGFELELHHPVSHAALGVFITVVGSESDAFQSHVRRKANDRLRKQFADQRKGRAEDAPTVEEVERNAIELLAACTTAWRTGDKPTITLAGEDLACSEGNARRLYEEKWIREQVDEAIGDLGNFMRG